MSRRRVNSRRRDRDRDSTKALARFLELLLGRPLAPWQLEAITVLLADPQRVDRLTTRAMRIHRLRRIPTSMSAGPFRHQQTTASSRLTGVAAETLVLDSLGSNG